MTTSDYLESLQDDLSRTIEALDLQEGTNFTDIADMVENGDISKSTPEFTGHYDATGLAQIGWSNNEIQYYQDNGVQWNSSDDNSFKLTSTELAGDDTSNTRYIPKNTIISNFLDYNRLIAIPIINISGITDMTTMFKNCYSLTTIPLLDTSNVTNMSTVFSYCRSLTTIPLLDTSSVTDMSSMFTYCGSLTKVPLLNTSNVTDMNMMFSYCFSLKSVPLLNTSSVTNMNGMFASCYSLKSVPLLNTSSVTNMNGMFKNCYSLKSVPLLDTSSVTNMGSMFSADVVLTDASLDNILQMCINTTSSYTGNKKLSTIGLTSTNYPSSRIQALPHYQDFIDAGWVIGY